MHATQASRVLTILRRRCTPLHPATRRAGPSRYALLLGAIDARGPRQFKTVDELKGATRVSMLAAEPQNVGDLDTQLGLLRASELPPSTMRALNEADDHWPSVVDVLLKSGEYIVEYVSVHAAKVLGATVIVHRPIVWRVQPGNRFVSLRACVITSARSGCICVSASLCLCVYVSLCICVSVSLCLCLSVYVSLCLSLSVCLSVCLSVSLSLCLSVSLYLCVSVPLCLCVSVSMCLCVSVSLRLCVSVSLSVRGCRVSGVWCFFVV